MISQAADIFTKAPAPQLLAPDLEVLSIVPDVPLPEGGVDMKQTNLWFSISDNGCQECHPRACYARAFVGSERFCEQQYQL